MRFICVNNYVDEGVSHIPFNLLLTDKGSFIEFCELCFHKLRRLHVTLVVAEKSHVLRRLKSRGHSRFDDGFSADMIEIYAYQNALVTELMALYYPIYVKKFEISCND